MRKTGPTSDVIASHSHVLYLSILVIIASELLLTASGEAFVSNSKRKVSPSLCTRAFRLPFYPSVAITQQEPLAAR